MGLKSRVFNGNLFNKYPTFLRKILDYYLSNDMEEVKKWTYENGIQGITPEREKNKISDL